MHCIIRIPSSAKSGSRFIKAEEDSPAIEMTYSTHEIKREIIDPFNSISGYNRDLSFFLTTTKYNSISIKYNWTWIIISITAIMEMEIFRSNLSYKISISVNWMLLRVSKILEFSINVQNLFLLYVWHRGLIHVKIQLILRKYKMV